MIGAADAMTVRVGTSPAQPAPEAKDTGEGVVNINTATVDQLMMLPGIGPSKAAAIVAYRSKKPFKQPRHLIRVRGIGRKTLGQVLPYVVVDGPTTLSE